MNNLIFNVDEITSKANSTIVKIGKLDNKKYRNEEKLFVCNGIKLFREAVKFNAKIQYIVLNNTTNFEHDIVELIKEQQNKGISILCVNDIVFSKLSEEKSPQGIITVCKYFDNFATPRLC